MRAVHVPEANQPAVLADLPAPDVSNDTVLVRVRAAGLNAIDNVIAAGGMAEMVPHEYPLTLGRDAAGVVEAVGTAVDHVGVGDRVVGHMLMSAPLRQGTLADLALLPAAAVVRLPDEVDFTTAAALPLAGAAAHAVVEAVKPLPGQVVLVNGATGGVGGFVVQLLASCGATVIATGTPADADRLRAQGAAEVVDYTAGPIATQVGELHPGGVDALVELVAQTPQQSPLEAVRESGTVITSTGQPDADTLNAWPERHDRPGNPGGGRDRGAGQCRRGRRPHCRCAHYPSARGGPPRAGHHRRRSGPRQDRRHHIRLTVNI